MPKGWRLQSNEFSSVYLKIFDSEYKIYIDQTFNLTFTKSYKMFFHKFNYLTFYYKCYINNIMEGNWLDEDTDLKSAGRNCFGGSSPSPSAIFI